jgi:hypothetical protein
MKERTMHASLVSRRAFAATTMAMAASPLVRGLAHESTPEASPVGDECVPIEDAEGCLPIAPADERVDLAPPVFSNPTQVTNPHFPITTLMQVVQLGNEGGDPLRVEVTLLPETNVIEWNGVPVENVASQFVAYSDGRIAEVAIDFYAQADDGAVWYFGEDVFNYEDGEIANTDGTWLAGPDGPAGMIMPGNPQVGDVYRPENIPGLVFEEVTVLAVDETVEGPQGALDGAIRIQELLMDGTTEEKLFAPGYGEFQAEAEDEFVIVAIGVPLDARDEVVPDELTGAVREVASAAGLADWDAVDLAMTALEDAWSAYREIAPPPVLVEQMDEALAALVEVVEARDAGAATQVALVVERAALDFRLIHEAVPEVDRARIGLWARQLMADVDDAAAVLSDVVILESIWARSGHAIDDSGIAVELVDLRAAVDAGDFVGAAAIAERLAEAGS